MKIIFLLCARKRNMACGSLSISDWAKFSVFLTGTVWLKKEKSARNLADFSQLRKMNNPTLKAS